MSFKAIFTTVLAAAVIGGVHAAAVAREAETYFGDATLYYPSGAFGACGSTQNNGFFVALSPTEYADGANCFQTIGINSDQGRFVEATVVDLCIECASGSIALSLLAFEQLSSGPSPGPDISVSWNYEH